MRRFVLGLALCIALAGSAFASHSVVLSCTASTTLGVTYDFYRSTTSGGPYSQVNVSPMSLCGFTDTIVSNGTTYYYVARSFDSVTLSGNSNQVTAVIPTAPAAPVNLSATVK